jgi:hypothetical protein
MAICLLDGYNAAVMPSQITATKRSYQGAVLLVLVSLLLLAYALRLHNLDAFSFWTDEGLTPLRSGYPVSEILSNRITIQEGVTKDTHPPLYYLVIHVTQQLFGQSDFAYRYPSLLAGVLLVPLLFQFGRRLQSTLAGLFAALFTAVSPLQIYYGNEARMYTLFVLLAAGASYVLWRALNGAELRRCLLLYFLLAGLAFYTHYTAVFLIAAQGLFWIWLLWREGYKRLIIGLGIASLLLAIPVVPFTVPRFFTGAEADYFYVPPPVMLMDVLRFFGLGLTADFNEVFVTVILLAMFMLALVGLYAAGSWLKRFFLLAYLLAVVFGLMAGSLVKPMYQGVRHIMVGSPAFILLLAMGTDYLLRFGRRTGSKNMQVALRTAGILLASAVLLGSAYAVNNLYHDPNYAKDDLRGLIRYVERRAGKDDVVLYHNAILLPLHDHYRTREDLPATALPVYPHTADGVEEQLADLASTVERIWYVTDPPADDRDIDGRVPGWLMDNLQDIDNESFHARTTVVHSTGYRSAPANLDAIPAEGVELDLAWPGLPPLVGMVVDVEQAAGGDTLWIDLAWDGDPAPAADTIIRFWLQDGEGSSWAVYEQPLSDNFSNWPAERLVRESYRLPLPEGLPAAVYTLMVQPQSGAGQLIGDAHQLTDLDINPSPGLAGGEVIVFENGLALHSIDWFDSDIHPGHNMSAILFWQTEPGRQVAVDDLRYELEVVAPDGEVVRTLGGKPGASAMDQMAGDTAVRQRVDIFFPPESEPGQYRLRWRLSDGDSIIRGRPAWRPWYGEAVNYDSIRVTPWPLDRTLPEDVVLSGARFGPAIQLYGYEAGVPEQGKQPLTLYWLADGAPAGNYLVFVHVVDPSTGEIVSQVDRIPLDGLRPTAGWRPGEVLRDEIPLPLPADLAAGEYVINIGMYDPDSSERLPLAVDGERQANDQLTIHRVVLP